jgi:uracil-DNA glycosylase family 4
MAISSSIALPRKTGDRVHMSNSDGTGHIGPPGDCTMCRLGTTLIPTQPGDIRGWQEFTVEAGQGPWVKPHRTQVVKGDGPVPCPVMLVGESPGFQEDRDGSPFRPGTPAGKVLAQVMAQVGLKRWPSGVVFDDDAYVYVTYALKCRPVDNKTDKFLDCLEVCRGMWLRQEIAAVKPKVIVALGKTAAQPWFGKEGALTVRQLSRDSAMLGPVVADTWDDEDGVMVIHAPAPGMVARGAEDARVKLVNALRLAKEVGYGA